MDDNDLVLARRGDLRALAPLAAEFPKAWSVGDHAAFNRLAAAAEEEDGPSPGAGAIAVERYRQVTGEGYTPEHDAGHTRGELARAGAVYALRAVSAGGANPYDPMRYWPPDWHFKADFDRDSDPLVMLTKAGALITAEIDRLLAARAAPGATEPRRETPGEAEALGGDPDATGPGDLAWITQQEVEDALWDLDWSGPAISGAVDPLWRKLNGLLRKVQPVPDAIPSWASGICSAHQEPDPRCRMCNPAIAAAVAQAKIAERDRCAALAEQVGAFYDAPCPDGAAGCVHQDTPFADLIRRTP